MMKTNITFLKRRMKQTTLLLSFFFSIMCTGNVLIAQCSLACNGTTQVSLAVDCTAEITPEMILNDEATSCPGGTFVVTVMDQNGLAIPTSPFIGPDEVGKTLQVKVEDTTYPGNNSCWGNIVVEDKIAPTIDCAAAQADIDAAIFYCYDLSSFNIADYVLENCDIDTIILSSSLDTPNDCTNPANDEILKTTVREYIVIDKAGNQSTTCELTFTVNRIPAPFTNLVYPVSLLLSGNNALECDGVYTRDANGHPHPSVTGVPSLDTDSNLATTTDQIALYPNPNTTCNILAGYSDLELPAIGCVTKIMRTWTVVEWTCNSRTFPAVVQMIEIVDNEAPVFTCPNDFTVTTNTIGDYNTASHGDLTCGAYVSVPPVTAVDNCDTNAPRVDVIYTNGFLSNQNGGTVELPLGVNEVTYVVYDGCLNSSSCTINVTVEDNTAPVAVCIQNTAVGLTNDGEAEVYASSFDNGSYDDCQLKKTLVRRMNPAPCACDSHPELPWFDYLGANNGKFYYISKDSLTGSVARKMAVAHGGDLTSISSEDEHLFVFNAAMAQNPNNQYFIGFTDSQSEGSFKWSDGTPVTYTNWQAGQPTGNGDYVVVRNNGTWRDVNPAREEKYVIEISDQCGLASHVRFCCEDISGGDVMVVFRAIDINGNYNDCMVSVEVQDKLAPTITCPQDLTVTCKTLYDINNLTADFGTATAYDNCNVVMEETHVSNISQCNTGTITRTFTATDDGGRTASCTQVITLENPSPFGCEDIYAPFGQPDDIIWPADPETMNGCFDPTSADFHPDVTGYPAFSDDQCELVGANYVDQIFPFNNGNGEACFKIVRDWTVIDWCQFGTKCGYPIGNQYATWKWTQIIKVANLVKPTITSSCEPKSTCTYDALCVSGYIELTATATDDCTDVLNYTYSIDLNSDGIFDGVPVTGNSNSIDASGDYPIGNHIIRYSFRDKCGNITVCDQEFSIVNCKAPTPYCLNGLATDLMPVDTDNDGTVDWGMIEIWASDFDNGGTHPCGYRVVTSFSQDTTNKNITFDCNTQGQQAVDVYFTAVDANDNIISFAYCTTYIVIQDNMNACALVPTPNARISGLVATENSERLENVSVALNGSNLQNANTDANGEYAFPEMNTGGSYVLNPTKNVDPMNGVSTLDLVLIQKHILGIDNLDTPYKHIAADINKDAKISAVDLVELRKLILGVTTEFSNNESWRFIDADYEFVNVNSPLTSDLPESYNIESLNSNMAIDFTAVKVGDVNNTVVTNLAGQNIDNRNAQTLNFNVSDVKFKAGDMVEVPFKTTENVDILGYQFTLDFDADVLEFVDSKSGEILTNSYNYGTAHADQGMITSSWNTVTPELISANNIAFSVVFRAKADGTLSNNLDINSQLTAAEAYDANQEVMNIEVNFDNRGSEKGLGYVLYQNTPNPFDNSTEISFHLPESMKAQLRIYDVTGKTLKVYSDVYAAGMNMIVVDKNALSSAGILYYTLETDNFTATKRMVVIK